MVLDPALLFAVLKEDLVVLAVKGQDMEILTVLGETVLEI